MPSEKESEIIPKRNNFEDLQEYYLKCAVISAISRFRDSKGWSPSVCRAMLIDLLRFNDNTGNKVFVIMTSLKISFPTLTGFVYLSA